MNKLDIEQESKRIYKKIAKNVGINEKEKFTIAGLS